MSGDSREAGRRDTPAVRTIRISPKLARRNLRRQIRRDASRRPGKYALIRRGWGVGVDVNHALRALEFGVAQAEGHQVGDNARPVGGREPLIRYFPYLRRVQADPDLARLRAIRPEAEELVEIAGPVDLLPRDRAVNGDSVPGDVLEDAVVGGRRPAHVVLGLQPVDGNDNRGAREAGEKSRDFTHGARDELGVNASLRENGNQCFQLAIAYERLATDDRDVQRLVLINQAQHPINEFLPLEVANLTQGDLAAEMVVAVRIAPRTAQRALASDFDRERRCVPCEDPTPGSDDAIHDP